ncbi:glycosyl hydrolase family 28-related protein [Kribbella sp. CA-293567]|uniref:glycosyl hydrolase family 28-related protein n=1 Tax=Kribbella sp. CA-293567 TaxID=3002436 RepID=UPI0022DDBBC1|nr:glycosyl hydrolase family 28-related protein [Kribbella sp. CA-293567]WBQ05835.1 glycosyl hydrolase family 28-related protein [Kribbella sp. CA-293567]
MSPVSQFLFRCRPVLIGAVVGALLAVPGLSAAAGPATTAGRPSHPNQPPQVAPVVTRAGLDPALVQGRGATVPFVEQEAENAATTGEKIGPGREAYTLPAEASGRTAVRLTQAGQYVEFTLSKPANALTLRYSIPDTASGGGLRSPLDVLVNGKRAKTMTLTSEYSWLYGMYPFSNDPNVDPNPGWWKPEPDPVTKPFRPNHFYDEQRLLLGKTVKAGQKIRFQLPAGAPAAWTVLDVADFELVAAPLRQPRRSLSVQLFGADPTGRRDAAPAIDRTIAVAKKLGLAVFIPPGTYQVNRHIVVDKVTVTGAGNWWTIIKGKVLPLAQPAPDKSVHGAPGFYGKYAADGGSTKVHLSDFAIESDVRERIDTDQVNGIGGALGGGSVIQNLYLHRTKVGIWLDGPMSGALIRNNVITDAVADGMNLHLGVSHVRATNNFVRNTGDDGLAMWSEANADGLVNHDNVYDHNTVQTPTLANNIAIYGGRDNAVTDNLVADPLREGSTLHAGSRFNSTPFEGTLSFARNTTVRGGPRDLNWDLGLGAIWLYALQSDLAGRIEVTDSSFLDSTYNAFMFVVDWPVKDEHTVTNVAFLNIKVDGTGTNVLNARVGGWATFENVDARNVGAPFVNNCGTFHFTGTPEFDVRLGAGNDGNWTTDAGAPGHCEDRPAVVPPPPPTPWN